jgi:hypothetical protein
MGGTVVAPSDYRTVGYIGPKTRKGNTKDDKLAKDRDAYARLRKDGLHPGHIGGSDHLEKHATLPIEVEMGHVFKSRVGKALAQEGVERSLEIGVRGIGS